MSETVHFSQITEPELLDIVDNAWLQDKLPDDSEHLEPAQFLHADSSLCAAYGWLEHTTPRSHVQLCKVANDCMCNCV